jgi:hypothetical protein
VIQDIFNFIGVDPNFTPDMSKKYNVSIIPRNRQLDKIMNSKSRVRSALRSLVPASARPQIRRFIQQQNSRRLTLAPEIHRELTDAFRDDIRLLERLLDRDLSHWLNRASHRVAQAQLS